MTDTSGVQVWTRSFDLDAAVRGVFPIVDELEDDPRRITTGFSVRFWPKADGQKWAVNVRLRLKAVVRLTAGMVTNARYSMTAIPG